MVIRIYKKPNGMYDVFEYSTLYGTEYWLFSRNDPDNVFMELSHLVDFKYIIEFIDKEFE